MIHSYKMGGYNIVLDVCSGSVHVVDDAAYDIIHAFETQPRGALLDSLEDGYAAKGVTRQELETCYDQILDLKNQGKLFAPDVFAAEAGTLKARSGGVIKALCLHVAHTCNLNCAYCFASQGKYHGERAIMSLEVGKRALDFLVEHSGSRKNLEVDFFGGEPLMNFEMIEELVAYARTLEPIHHKHFRFTLTTNGVLLDEKVTEFANRECHNVVLSLDGRKEVHDRYRVDYAGRGSWEKIVPKFQAFVKARGNRDYYMRGTFTHFNPDFLKDIETMLDLGFTELSMEPVVAAPGDEAALTEEDLPIVMEQYEKLAMLMKKRREEGRPFTFYHYMLDLTGGPCIYKRISGCGSGTEYMAVTPWGDLYPCHQFVGEEKFRLGDIWQGVTNEAVRQEFAGCNVYAHDACRDCWARLYCAGGCAANAYHATGTIRGVYDLGCKLFRKRMECALFLAVDKQLSEG